MRLQVGSLFDSGSESCAWTAPDERRMLAAAVDDRERHGGGLAGRRSGHDQLKRCGAGWHGERLAAGDGLTVEGDPGVQERPEAELTERVGGTGVERGAGDDGAKLATAGRRRNGDGRLRGA